METFEYKGIKYPGTPSIDFFMRVVKEYEEELRKIKESREVKEELDQPESRLKNNILLVTDGLYLNIDDSFILDCDDIYDLYGREIKFIFDVRSKAYDTKFTISIDYDNVSECPPINKLIKDFRENEDDAKETLRKEINKVIHNWISYPSTDKTLEDTLRDYLTY